MKTDREKLYSGLTHAAWGYFLLHVDFKLGTVSVLPAFAGYLLLLSAIGDLSGERRDLALLRPLGMGLAACNGADWLLSWAGRSIGGLFLPLDLIITAASLYFHFQFITDMAALAGTYQPEGSGLERRLLRCRTVYLVLTTAAHVLMYLPEDVLRQGREVALGVLAAALVAAMLFIMAGLFGLRRIFREEPLQRPEA